MVCLCQNRKENNVVFMTFLDPFWVSRPRGEALSPSAVYLWANDGARFLLMFHSPRSCKKLLRCVLSNAGRLELR